MATHDTDNKPYAVMSTLKPGDFLKADSGFTCIPPDTRLKVFITIKDRIKRLFRKPHDLYIPCAEGKHFLDGQDDGDGSLVGLYKCDP